MSKVALIRCTSYDYEKVKIAVTRGMELIGGIDQFVKSGEKILLKPNLLSADPPEKCVTTHPAIFKAVAEVCQKAGADLSFGDSPAFQSTKTAAKKAGILSVAEELGVKMMDFGVGEEISFPEGMQNKKFTIAQAIRQNDGMISIPKLKTHGFAKMTGAVKCQFGCIPGTLKGEFHVKLPDINNFSKMLVDLNLLVKPRLFIMDGIIGMDGNGPRGGQPKAMNIILFSADPIALDATVCRMVKLAPEYVPTIKFGQEAGLGTYQEDQIELVGDNINDFFNESFDVPREPLNPYKPGRVIGFARNLLVPKPVIDPIKCKKCGVCVQICPVQPKAVNWHDGNKAKAPTHVYKSCIRCYCCQELCPESAIKLKIPLIRKIFGKK